MRQGTAREAKEAIIRSFGGENSFCCVVYTENLMESGEVLDLGELARQVAGSHGASDSALRRRRVADAAQQVRTSRSKNLLSPPS
jgi:hypothetical protein